jgi:hypothetical protein
MKVTMDIFAQLDTCRASATGITVAAAAQQIVCKRNGDWQFAVALRAADEQRMSEPVIIDTAAQSVNHSLLSYNIFKEYSHQ